MLVHSFQPSWKFAYKTWIALPQLAVQKYAFECGISLGQSLQHVGLKYVEMRRSSREKNILRNQFWPRAYHGWPRILLWKKRLILVWKHRLFARCWEAIVWPPSVRKSHGTCAGNPMDTPMGKSRKRCVRCAWAGHMGRVFALRAMGSGISGFLRVFWTWTFSANRPVFNSLQA